MTRKIKHFEQFEEKKRNNCTLRSKQYKRYKRRKSFHILLIFLSETSRYILINYIRKEENGIKVSVLKTYHLCI